MTARHGDLFLTGDPGPLAALSNASDLFASGLAQLRGHRAEVSAREVYDATIRETGARFDSLLRGQRQFTFDFEGRRVDSFSPGAGLFMARQLEHIYADILREPIPELSSLTIFPTDSSVAPGARSHTVRRLYQNGEAKIYRDGQGVPQVGLSQKEEQFPVRHIATSFGSTVFDDLSAQFANIGLLSENLRTARDACAQLENRLNWYGSDDDGLYGVLNYPWLDRVVVATPFDGSASPDDVIAELNALANYAVEHSRSRMRPNTVVFSQRVADYLTSTPRSQTTDTSILAWWLANNAMGIKDYKVAWELGQDAGFAGNAEGILFFRNDRLGICLVQVQPFTTLPIQFFGFAQTTYCYQSTGGVIMRDVGNNILGLVDVGL